MVNSVIRDLHLPIPFKRKGLIYSSIQQSITSRSTPVKHHGIERQVEGGVKTEKQRVPASKIGSHVDSLEGRGLRQKWWYNLNDGIFELWGAGEMISFL